MKEKSSRRPLMLRLPKELWKFLKLESVYKEKSMNEIIVSYVNKNFIKSKKAKEKELTSED